MPLLLSSSSIIPPSHKITQCKLCSPKFQRSIPSNPNCSFVHGNIPSDLPSVTKSNRTIFRNKPVSTLKFMSRECRNHNNELLGEQSMVTYESEDQEQEDMENVGTPWEGAIVYKRDPSISHVEYCTTLERLGLGNVSTEVSKSQASSMGLRVTKYVKDFPLGTPVLISLDVTRKKRKLRLNGIIRTVITLGCNRCGEPTAESVFSTFSLLLSEEPIEEPETINMGVIFGGGKFKTSGSSEEEDKDDEALIDLDDRLYFPPGEKAIDISKQIRDLVHLEITISAICDPMCKGLCLSCGANLNTGGCNCSKQKVKEMGYGPFRGLKERMKQR